MLFGRLPLIGWQNDGIFTRHDALKFRTRNPCTTTHKGIRPHILPLSSHAFIRDVPPNCPRQPHRTNASAYPHQQPTYLVKKSAKLPLFYFFGSWNRRPRPRRRATCYKIMLWIHNPSMIFQRRVPGAYDVDVCVRGLNQFRSTRLRQRMFHDFVMCQRVVHSSGFAARI